MVHGCQHACYMVTNMHATWLPCVRYMAAKNAHYMAAKMDASYTKKESPSNFNYQRSSSSVATNLKVDHVPEALQIFCRGNLVPGSFLHRPQKVLVYTKAVAVAITTVVRIVHGAVSCQLYHSTISTTTSFVSCSVTDKEIVGYEEVVTQLYVHSLHIFEARKLVGSISVLS